MKTYRNYLYILLLVGALFIIYGFSRPMKQSAASPKLDSSVNHVKQVVTSHLLPPACINHAVVCQGVHSIAEYNNVVKTDPVVRSLYAPIGQVHLDKLDRATFAYDSYRIGNIIYWTKTPRFMPAGEPIITDGKYAILQRCGNMISLTPQTPVSELAPPADIYPLAPTPMTPNFIVEAPEIPLEYPPPFIVANVLPAPPTETQPPYTSIYGFGPGTPQANIATNTVSPVRPVFPNTPGTPVPTPEASTGYFVIIGLLGLLAIRGGKLYE